MRSVDICVATYRRPQLLEQLLTSIEQQVTDGVERRVILVDNDGAQSARAVGESFGQRMPLVYVHEGRPGVCLTRNRALDLAAAEYVAFIDDDEVAAPDWLQQLLICLERTHADAAFGPVFQRLPVEAPAWTRRHFLFRPRQHENDAAVDCGFTGSALVRRSAIGCERFDPKRSLTGGEDVEFFHRLHRMGRRLVWCQDAHAWEAVGGERLTEEWVFRRAFRTGFDYADVFVKPRGRLRQRVWAATKTVQLGLAQLGLAVVRCADADAAVILESKIWAARGHLVALAGSQPNWSEYAYGRTSQAF